MDKVSRICRIIFGSIFSLLGLTLIVLLFFEMTFLENRKDYIKTDSVIISKQGEGSIVRYNINYDVDNITYSYQFQGTDDYELNDILPIYYCPNDPTDIFWGARSINLQYVFFVLFVFGMGLYLLINGIRSFKTKEITA